MLGSGGSFVALVAALHSPWEKTRALCECFVPILRPTEFLCIAVQLAYSCL